MSTNPLADAVTKLVAAHCPRDQVAQYATDRFHPQLWRAMAGAGYTGVGVAEEHGGSGGTAGDALTIARVVGKHAGAVPVGEHALLAGWLLTAAGWQLTDAPLTAAAPNADEVRATWRPDGSLRLDGTVRHVPWLVDATALALLCEDGTDSVVCLIPVGDLDLRPGLNMAGEGRDTVRFDAHLVPADAARKVGDRVTRTEFQLRGAATRVALTAGAIERIVELTVRYAGERVQFGRPINQFQAAAHRLAQLAGEARVVTGSADAVIAADRFDAIEIAAAKASAGPAASNAVAQAHQLHGAIGITREYPLNFFTRRVWSWRAEYGSSTVWSDLLGATLAESEDLWIVLADG